MIISVKAVVFSKGKFLLLKPTNNSNSINGWDGPGGKLEEGESILDGLIREVKEETGMAINRAIPITTLKLPNNHIEYMIFLCTVDSDQIKLSSEHSDYKWVTGKEFEELTRFDLNGLIGQLITLLTEASVN